MRDGRTEPGGRGGILEQDVDRPSGEAARLAAWNRWPGLS